MLNNILLSLQEKSAKRKSEIFQSFFKKKESVLDFGCGDLSLAKALYKKNRHLTVTGIDVVDFKSKLKNIHFKKYDGITIPFKNNSFDTVISVFVFHHCESAEESLRECLRVAKKRVIIMEAVARNKGEIPLMKFIDWLTNVWKREDIPLTYQFKTYEEWKRIFRKLKTELKTTKQEPNVVSMLPIGGTFIFEIIKK